MATTMTILKAKGATHKPMLSLPFLDWFESYDFSSFNFIEFGSGNSTKYFAEKVKSMISFETNLDFFNSFNSQLPENLTYKFLNNHDLEDGKFNLNIDEKTIVLVDCAANRLSTTKNVFKFGFPNILILDNSELYRNTCKFINEQGYMEIPFWGLRFLESEEACTSVFIKNTFSMIEKNYNYYSVGSVMENGVNTWDL
jgi:hypothetical protein